MRRVFVLSSLVLLALAGCKDEVSLTHTHVFGTGGAVGPALTTLTALIPSEYGSVPMPGGMDTLTYESAFFKILVDLQEYGEADVKVGDVSLTYQSDKGLYMALDSSGAPVEVSLAGGTQVNITVPKYSERISFTLPAVSPPDTVMVDTLVHAQGDSIRVSWSPVNDVDSVQVFFKLADRDPYIKNLPPTDTVFYIPAAKVDTTGTALIMVNVLKLVNIAEGQTPSYMIIVKGKALPPVVIE